MGEIDGVLEDRAVSRTWEPYSSGVPPAGAPARAPSRFSPRLIWCRSAEVNSSGLLCIALKSSSRHRDGNGQTARDRDLPDAYGLGRRQIQEVNIRESG